jgi:hypothetical protein
MACAKAVMRNGIRNIILSGTINFHTDNIQKQEIEKGERI